MTRRIPNGTPYGYRALHPIRPWSVRRRAIRGALDLIEKPIRRPAAAASRSAAYAHARRGPHISEGLSEYRELQDQSPR